MVTPGNHVMPKRVTYKTEISLFRRQWDLLAVEAERRRISGKELIESVLSQHIAQVQGREDVPLPEAPPEDA